MASADLGVQCLVCAVASEAAARLRQCDQPGRGGASRLILVSRINIMLAAIDLMYGRAAEWRQAHSSEVKRAPRADEQAVILARRSFQIFFTVRGFIALHSEN